MTGACIIVLAAAATASALWAAPECMVPTGEYLPTQVPHTYVLDRRDPYEADYLDRYQTGMPRLIETGALTPGHPYFGPMCDLTALREGRPEKSVEEFVQQYRENRERTREAVERLRAAGAERVITYICMMTTGGDPEPRTGFWRFYDNWEAFSEFDIPPKPAEDPENWQQRNPDGSPFIAYRRAHPPYQPMFRWTNCVNSPAWQTYQQWITQETARLGVDGFFVDNAGTQRCYCTHCQAKFADWLKSRYTEPELAELFRGDLAMAPEGDANTDLRKAEVQLFWQESIHQCLSRIRQWGSEIHGSFFVFPNGLHGRAHFVATRFRDCDLAMDENSSGELGGQPGSASVHIVAGLHVKDTNDNLLTYKYAAGTGARCRGNLLCYSGYPNSDLANLGPNANVAALGMAEPAAFGGGGCYAPVSAHPWLGPPRETFNRFFDANADLYQGKYPFGQVGIIAFVLPNYFGDLSTFSAAAGVLHTLLDRHTLADLIPERVFTREWIARYRTLIVPSVRIMSDAQLDMLLAYARDGGRLILLGEQIAARDQLGRERPAEAAQRLEEAATAQYQYDLAQAFEAGGPLAGLELCPQDAGPLVRFAAYVDDPQQPTELILHCVNYDLDLGTEHDRVGTVRDLELSMPLPLGTRAARASYHAPGEQGAQLSVQNQGDRARVVLPRLDIYAVVHIPLERGGAQ